MFALCRQLRVFLNCHVAIYVHACVDLRSVRGPYPCLSEAFLDLCSDGKPFSPLQRWSSHHGRHFSTPFVYSVLPIHLPIQLKQALVSLLRCELTFIWMELFNTDRAWLTLVQTEYVFGFTVTTEQYPVRRICTFVVEIYLNPGPGFLPHLFSDKDTYSLYIFNKS